MEYLLSLQTAEHLILIITARLMLKGGALALRHLLGTQLTIGTAFQLLRLR